MRRRLRPRRKRHPKLDAAAGLSWWRHLLERFPMMYPTALTPILVGLVVGIMVTSPEHRLPTQKFPWAPSVCMCILSWCPALLASMLWVRTLMRTYCANRATLTHTLTPSAWLQDCTYSAFFIPVTTVFDISLTRCSTAMRLPDVPSLLPYGTFTWEHKRLTDCRLPSRAAGTGSPSPTLWQVWCLRVGTSCVCSCSDLRGAMCMPSTAELAGIALFACVPCVEHHSTGASA